MAAYVLPNEYNPCQKLSLEDAKSLMQGIYPQASEKLIKTEVEWELKSTNSRKVWTDNCLMQLCPNYEEILGEIAKDSLEKFIEYDEFNLVLDQDTQHILERAEFLSQVIPDIKTWDIYKKALAEKLELQARKERIIKANLSGWVNVMKSLLSVAITSSGGRNNTIPLESLFGISSSLFSAKPAEVRFFLEHFIGHPKNKFLKAVDLYNNGDTYVVCKIKLDADDVQELSELNGKRPMLLKPQYPNKHSEGRPIAGTAPATKGLPVNENTRWDALYRGSCTRWFWNRIVMDNYLFRYKKNFSRVKEGAEIAWGESIASWDASMRAAISLYEEMKELELLDNPMYFPTKPDGRIRIYYDSSMINPQMSEDRKGMLVMAPRGITQQGYEMLLLSIANALNFKVDGKSLDKHSVSFRIEMIRHMPTEELWALAQATEIDERYPENFQVQYTAEEPTRAFSAIYALERIRKGECFVTGETAAQDGVCQGMCLWGCGTQDPEIMHWTCLTSGKERKDFYLLFAKALGISRSLAKDALKVLMYGGMSGMKKVLQDEDLYDRFVEFSNRFPVFRLIRKIARFWKSSWEAIRFKLPDNTSTEIWPEFKVRNEETGEEESGIWLRSKFFSSIVDWKIRAYGHLEHSASLAAHVNHSSDGYVLAEVLRKCAFDPLKKDLLRRIREHRAYMRSSLYDHEHKYNDADIDYSFAFKEVNPKSKKNAELLQCLYRGAQVGWYSFRILDLLDESNQAMVPDEVLDYLYYELPEEPIELGLIHDSLISHVNDGWEVQNQYRRIIYFFAQSTWYDEIFRQLGLNIRMPRRNSTLNLQILKAENLFG